MKKKTLGLIIAGVAAASMIGTGFAAWIITASATETENGQFAVDTVTEKSLTITPSFASGEGTINFLAPANATTGWLTSDGLTGTEKLFTDLTVNFETTGEVSKASDFKVTYAIDYSAVQAAINANYITAPVLKIGASTNVTDVALTSTTTTDSVTLRIEFGWGSAFELEGANVNTYTYYNSLTNNETNRTAAKTALTALYNAVNDAEFTITITAKPATANN